VKFEPNQKSAPDLVPGGDRVDEAITIDAPPSRPGYRL
jgi:hypothetical protein